MKLKALAMAAMVGLGTLPMALQAAEVPEGPHVVTSGTASAWTPRRISPPWRSK